MRLTLSFGDSPSPTLSTPLTSAINTLSSSSSAYLTSLMLLTLSLSSGCLESTDSPTPMVERDAETQSDEGALDDEGVQVMDMMVTPEVDQGRLGDQGPTPPPLESEYGEPCRANIDCLSGYCIASPQGFICSQDCLLDSDCPTVGITMTCDLNVSNFGPDIQQICAPSADSFCQPCFRDDQCFGGRCVSSPQGNVCTVSCDEEGQCPTGAECQASDESGRVFDEPQCIPNTALCGCDESNAGATRSCVRTSEAVEGRCFGVETCDPAVGWSGCDAAAPSVELCDGVDNDCNGAIDDGLVASEPCTNENEFGSCQGDQLCRGAEGWSCVAPAPSAERCDRVDNDCDGRLDEDFQDEQGRYQDAEHCGGCGIDCRDQLPLASAVACVLTEDGEDDPEGEGAGFQCVVTECRVGFFRASETQCLPLTTNLCDPCERDEDCNQGTGDRCLDYGGEIGFCGRNCAPSSPFGEGCPDGFSCDQSGQCRLDVGTCLCSESDQFIIPCSVTSPLDPNTTCIGNLTCDRGSLSACEVPPERCDSFDDDCDGSIDEDFVNTDGLYASDQHCGRCGVDCDAIVNSEDPRGVGVCEVLNGAPQCALDCIAGYVDVNGVQADGCECELLDPERDAPDRLGIDANCDGIDGEVARGVFVSPSGDDNALGTRSQPLRTLSAALNLAGGARDHIYVAAGVYTESISLRAGISMFGGYSANYARRDLRGNETAIFPPLSVAGERLGTVTGLDIVEVETVFSGFTVVGHVESRPSQSSYAIYLRNCDTSLRLLDNVIRAGSGGPGLRGQAGQAGTNAPDNALLGSVERNASQDECLFSANNISPGGRGGRHSCVVGSGATVLTDGGDGGSSDCPVFNQPESSGGSGQANTQAAGGRGGYNQQLLTSGGRCYCLIPSDESATETGIPGESGEAGLLGAAGEGCEDSAGRVIGGHWVAGPAGAPQDGRAYSGGEGGVGGGGGGGGAGSGVEHQPFGSCNSLYGEVIGGGGGGGGAGGCGGSSGSGGQSGGGSFGIFIFYTAPSSELPILTDNVIERGFGGLGGDGGEGGEGGLGGLGKEALALSPEDRQNSLLVCADPGGRGGDGGTGGNGGGGGGGCGGIAAGIFINQLNSPVPPDLSVENTFPLTGAGGTGGSGGLSLGLTGRPGADGRYVEVAQ